MFAAESSLLTVSACTPSCKLFESSNADPIAFKLQAVAGQMSIRVQQLTCQSVTKTKDNVQLTVSVAVQYQAVRERVDDAYYKLSNVESQLSSYVDDIIRSALPTLTLDEAFETKDHVAEHVKSGLEVRGSFTVPAAVAP